MHDFKYVNDELYCEGVPVSRIAEDIGTPFYLYSTRTLTNHYRVFDRAFSGLRHIVCYSVKANSNVAILKLLVKEGAGVDIVSGGELYRALQAGVEPGKVVYSGVGKRVDEIEFALATDILMFNIESSEELMVIDRCAGRMKKKARIAVRINPDVDPRTHPHISTGLKENKFGVNIEKSLETYRWARTLGNIEVVGVDCHIGSQVIQIEPFVDALKRLKKLMGLLEKEGVRIGYLDLGGGLGITYDQELPPHPEEYGRAVKEVVKDTDVTVILEPGRVIVGNAGILVTRVLYQKQNENKNFVIVDAGMNDLIRPSLYGSYHALQPVVRKDREEFIADIVGPICESGDFIAKSRSVPKLEGGELLAVMSAGAYGFSMSSNYNSRPRIPEVLVNGEGYYVIRKRETYADLVRGEEIPDFLE
ncbi:MAG: diaminopimelate decarboxylase [Syntrophobacterales bacterium]|nr:diaminopimelate decarboxylase [Syntrophobacterales bacterium]